MLDFRVEPASGVAPYMQLVQQVKQALRLGWLQPGDKLSVHATYDTKRASWYEVMGIMPVAVYDGTGVGGRDAFSKKIPEKGVLTHGHLAENNHHGGAPTACRTR